MERLQDILIDIFENHEAPEKIQVILESDTREVVIKIDDLDDEWFRELKELSLTVMGNPQVIEKC